MLRELPSDEDRRILQEAVRGLFQGVSEKAAMMAPQLWKQLAAQGLTQIAASPAEGGLRELVLVQQEAGRAACRAPLADAALINLMQLAARADSPSLRNLLDDLHAGEAMVALSFASLDHHGASGRAEVQGGSLIAELGFIESANIVTHLAVFVPGPALAIVKTDRGVGSEPTPVMGKAGWWRVRIDAVPLVIVPFTEGEVRDLLAVAALSETARAFGAAQRAFEQAVAYAGERRQFGQPIGRFQAIQHKLANCHIALRAVQLTIANAAAQYDLEAAPWRWFAAAALATAAASLRQVSLETQHAFGAIGYSEEHEAPRHFRQVHLGVLRHGGQRPPFEQLASHFLDQDGDAQFPEYDLGAAGNAFRHEVRAWLDAHWSGERRARHEQLSFAEREYDREFARALGATGWIGLNWPKRFGGQERSAFEQLAFMEEMERAEAPRAGAPVQAAMLQVYGTPEQQQRYLPEILRGEAIYGMGYSEPQAGSDLASLKTRAVRESDHYVINGQKIWTTTYWGEYMLLATRTDPNASPPHAGITMFIVPMTTPGITIRPSETMYGGTFANIFYDDVRVPDDNRIGAEGEGWKVLTGALATERGFIGGGIVLKVAHMFELLCEHIRTAERRGSPMRRDPLVRARIGALAAEIEAGRRMMVHCAEQVDKGETPPDEAAVSKVYSGELMERFGETALDLLGAEALLSGHSPGAVLRGRIEQMLRHSLMWVISIGTNEIQRSLIAQRGLGLPR
ncbi:acyl-CoA dehydrogenase [Bradyrhizobium liaoningense]|uniref:acyl-CoA dehydrogenase n=1 Tax=Bradyrhizobium liaoningense TaxID=43992 RepID=UPI001BAAFDA7|nr:acyl-CoA dehydrogenase [Bradyrhizobium liaoningense]MBR0854492.1 acyl-CoA dehydrogenase [Bradyrhizobium liaoningense]